LPQIIDFKKPSEDDFKKPSEDDLKKSLEPYKNFIGEKNTKILLKNSWITEKIIDVLIPSVKFNYSDLSFKKKIVISLLRSGLGDYYRKLIAHKIYYDKDWIEGVAVNNI
jgi:hypothetical protein